VKYFDWSEEKNRVLKKQRGISFEDVKIAVEIGGVLENYNHSNQKRYPGQKVFVVEIDDYAYLVPYISEESRIFLKTVIPSRKATKKYLRREKR